MPDPYEDARRLAMELSYDERAKLSEELCWSLHPPAENVSQKEIDASWDAEIKRRLDEIDSGKVKMVPGKRSSHERTLASKPGGSKSRSKNEASQFPPGSRSRGRRSIRTLLVGYPNCRIQL
jgi:putative addiction module component (TIGR02574 family)